MTIEFGTDGWRAVISDRVHLRQRAAGGAGHCRGAAGERRDSRAEATATPLAVVGFDTRFLSDRYAWP